MKGSISFKSCKAAAAALVFTLLMALPCRAGFISTLLLVPAQGGQALASAPSVPAEPQLSKQTQQAHSEKKADTSPGQARHTPRD